MIIPSRNYDHYKYNIYTFGEQVMCPYKMDLTSGNNTNSINMMRASVYTIDHYEEQLKQFKKAFSLQKSLTLPNDRYPKLKPKRERVCRFCGFNSSKTTFKKAAHIVPLFLGNKYGISDFECDTCNAKFSIYESNLAYYLGLNRIFNRGISRNGVPTLKSRKLDIRQKILHQVDGIQMIMSDLENGAIEWTDDNILSISYTKQSYIPSHVYKILLKIGLSLLPEEELQFYERAFQYLLSDTNDITFSRMQSIIEFQFPLGNGTIVPYGYLFKKRQKSDQYPTHQCSIYFQNVVLSFCLPFNENDTKIGLYSRPLVQTLVPPPMSSSPFPSDIACKLSAIDLSSDIHVKGEVQTFQFKPDEQQLKNMVHFDPETGEEVKGEPNAKRIGLFLIPKGTILNLNQTKNKDL